MTRRTRSAHRLRRGQLRLRRPWNPADQICCARYSKADAIGVALVALGAIVIYVGARQRAGLIRDLALVQLPLLGRRIRDQRRLCLPERAHAAILALLGVPGAGEVEGAGDQERADQGRQGEERDQRKAALNRHRFSALRTKPHGLRSRFPEGVTMAPPPTGSLISPRTLSSVCPILRLTEGAPSPPGRVTLAGSTGFLALSCGTPLIQVVLLPEERETWPLTVTVLSTTTAVSWMLAWRRRSRSWRCCSVKKRRPRISWAVTGPAGSASRNATKKNRPANPTRFFPMAGRMRRLKRA